MSVYRDIIRPLLFRMDPEQAHELSLGLMSRALAPQCMQDIVRHMFACDAPGLSQQLWGLSFTNPIGLAAGCDKNAKAINPFAALGFGHVEVGTITGQGQPGNDKVRCFRLPQDQAIINRMGFNNDGADMVARRLAVSFDPVGGTRRPNCVLGINIGKTKLVPLEQALDDYQASIAVLAAYADYLVINVSSPNTPGLRDLQAEASLRPLLAGVRQALDDQRPEIPLLLKIAPDLNEAAIDAAVDVALETGCDGLIATNTTISRKGLVTNQKSIDAIGAGGLSGKPVRDMSDQVLARVCRRVDGQVPIIGVGGVFSAEDAWRKLSLGARLVQVYSGFIYQGPAMVKEITEGLILKMKQTGICSLDELIGRDL